MNAAEFYKEKVRPLREKGKPIPEDVYDKLYRLIKRLVNQIGRDFRMSSQEHEEVVTDACSMMLMRIQRGTLPIDIEDFLVPYTRKVVHGLWVKLVDERVKNCDNLMNRDWLDEMTVNLPEKEEPLSPDVILNNREDSKYYLETVADVALKIGRSQRIALLGFYCYRYDLDVQVLPVSPIERERVRLVLNTFNYYFNLKRPSWLEAQV